MLELVRDEPGEPLVERAEVILGRIASVLEDALVARCAGVAGLAPAKLPDDPISGLDPAIGRCVDVRRFLEDLEGLRKFPLRRDPAAVAGEPRLLPRCRDGGDPIGLLLRRVVFPQLRVGVRPPLERLEPAERCSVTNDREWRGRGKRRRDADDAPGVDSGRLHRRRNGVDEHIEPVTRLLERPRIREPFARAGKCGVDHAVGVLRHGRPEFLAVARSNDERPSREGAEVDTHDEALAGSGHCAMLSLTITPRQTAPPARAARPLQTRFSPTGDSYRRGAAVLCRTTSSGGTGAQAAERLPDSISSSMRLRALRPTSRKSCRIVVSGGMK